MLKSVFLRGNKKTFLQIQQTDVTSAVAVKKFFIFVLAVILCPDNPTESPLCFISLFQSDSLCSRLLCVREKAC